MRRVARHFQEDQELWGLTGLLHDLDYAETLEACERHGHRTVEILSVYDVPPAALHAIVAHPGHVPRVSRLDKALYAADPLTGLIIAGVLMHPQKKLAALEVDYVMRRFQEKRFAAGANRDQIQACSELDLSLHDFLKLGLEGMCEVAEQLGF